MNTCKLKKLLKNRVLIILGFMCVGKSTIGKRLSSLLAMSFVDTDKLIEEKESMPISEIFSEYGENYFRELEEKYILNLLKKEKSNEIISLGGGSLINKKVRLAIKNENVVSIWLNLDIKTIFARLNRSPQERPVANRLNSHEKIKTLFNKRIDYYKDANVEIKINQLSKNQVINLIYDKLISYLENRNEKN